MKRGFNVKERKKVTFERLTLNQIEIIVLLEYPALETSAQTLQITPIDIEYAAFHVDGLFNFILFQANGNNMNERRNGLESKIKRSTKYRTRPLFARQSYDRLM